MTNGLSSYMNNAMSENMTDNVIPQVSEQVSDDELTSYVEAIVRRSGTSFYWAMRRLPEEKRQAMFAIYAFCRVVDDIADNPGDNETKLAQLGEWRGEVERLFAGTPRHPVARALAGPVETYHLRKPDFHAVIDGMEMDAGHTVRIVDMAELELYCDRVACAVGRLSNRVFGIPGDIGDKLATSLGLALQFTNILRDVVEDVQIDRLYLPADVLRAHDIDPDNLKAIATHPRLPEVGEFLGLIAERRFQESRALVAECDPTAVRPAIMMMEIYHRILDKIRADKWAHPLQRISLSKFEKIWVLIRYGFI